MDMRRVGAGVFLGTALLVTTPASAAMPHVVQPGETLWSIAAANNLTIDDQNVDEDTEPGDTASVDVEIPESGVVQFYCAFHTAQDMRGALAVTGSEPTPAEDTTTESSGGGY